VEVAFEFQYPRASRERPGQTETVHRRLGSRTREADEFATGNRGTKQACEFGVQFVLVRASGSAVQNGIHGLAHARIAVAQQRRAVAATEVDIFATVEIPHSTTVRSVKEHRMAEGAVEARRCRHAAREVTAGFLELLDDTGHEDSLRGLLMKLSCRTAIMNYGFRPEPTRQP
jgi:hypothetical protein